MRAGGGDPRRLLAILERLGVLLLLLFALSLRARDLEGSFDRHFEGAQGGGNLLCALSYERIGLWGFGGYPLLSIYVLPERPETWYVYPNHPPLVPWLVYGSLKTLGPEGWEEVLAEGEAPPGLEAPVRAPFLLLHMAGLWIFWWALRGASGPLQAMLGLAVLATMPLSVAYGTLVNHETPSLVFVLGAYGCYARWVRGPDASRRRWLAGLGLCFAAAASVTYAPVFFVLPLILQRLLARETRRALGVGAVGLAACLVPLGLHAWWAGRQLEAIGRPAEALRERVGQLIGPLFDGSIPLTSWLVTQGELLELYLTWPLIAAAALGAGLLFARWLRSGNKIYSDAGAAPLALAPPLLIGGALVQLAFYGHTAGPQDTFLLNLAPGLAAAIAALLATLAVPLWRLRGGIAPLVILTSMLLLPGLLRAAALRQAWHAPGPADDPALASGHAAPLPRTSGRELAELLPAGACGVYPSRLGFHYATFFYAQRTLLPFADVQGVGLAELKLERWGLGARPLYVVFPLDPPGPARAQVEALRATFRELQPELAARPPDRATRSYEAWLIRS